MTEGTVDKPQLGLRRIIERPRLTRLLDESPARIKMLVAPAGYGKTTLARQWLKGSTQPVAWFAATPSSVDVAALAMGLHRAVTTSRPGIERVLLERLPVTANPQGEVEVLADVLADDLGSWPAEQWLVMDDYQEIVGATASERFVETLLLSSPINLLVLTRERPSWASARRILYGEISEFDRDTLAMTDNEARQLLGRDGGGSSTMIQASGGWPAAIALGSISPHAPEGTRLASDLHRFFAEELYQHIDDVARLGLWQIALVAPARVDAITKLLGPDKARHAIDVGHQQGFLMETQPGVIEIHPLLRYFLEDKLRAESSRSSKALVDGAFRYFLAYELWDEAFDLLSRFEVPDLLPQLVKSSLQEMLAMGRTETLRRWISRSGVTATESSIGLAAAELAFREGHYYASEVLANAAAESPQSDLLIETSALIVAGRAAHAASRERESLAFYIRAKANEVTPELTRIAAMGELVAAIELELPEASVLARTLESFDDLLPQDRVVLAGRVLNLQACFALPIDLDAGRAARQLLHLVSDPVARCSFRNVFGYALAACGEYDEALALTDEQLSDAERCRLEFVLPYAYCVQAISHGGVRYFDRAEEKLDEARRLALKSGDRTALAISRCLLVRLLTAQGAFRRAFAQPPQTRGLTKSLASELLASHAVARAGAGDVEKALKLAANADEISSASETSICVPAARAIAALHAGDTDLASDHAKDALRIALSTRMIESFVSSYRGCPELLVCLLQDKSTHDGVSAILALAGDEPIDNLHASKSVLSLSPREKEVLALLGHGLTNAQIGKQLFISPRTVKVHVRHIFEKLGVKSRTAAALRAVQIGRGHAAPDVINEASDGSR